MNGTMERIWSPYQQAIFEFIESRRASLLVEAVAGSGKTTTIVEAIRHVPSSQSVAFLAFNKSIAEELKRRVTSPNAKCMTLHAAGFNAWRQFLAWDAGNLQVDSRKTSKMIDALAERDEIDKEMIYTLGGEMGRLVSVAKSAGIVPGFPGLQAFHGLTPNDLEVWEELVEFYGLDEDKWDEDAIRIAQQVLAESVLQSREIIDFDDMLYMPIIAGATFEKYDVVFLDEAQDVSGIQVEMVDRMVSGEAKNAAEWGRPHRVIAVGDRHQAIYGFRGALSNSMDNIKERFGCEELPLSVSYRCPKLVVAHAQVWVPQIESFEEAPEGVVSYPESWNVKDFRAGDAVLCRVSRPTVELAFHLIRSKIPAKVLGRDIGQGLIKLIDKMKAMDLVDLDQKLVKYRAREAKKMSMTLEKLAALDDKLDTIRVFMDEQGLEDGTISSLKAAIESLFGEAADGARMVTLSTVHKAKGLEWPRVFILDADLYMPSKWARQPWQQQQEANLQYVAVTRAKQELVYISTLSISEARNEQEGLG